MENDVSPKMFSGTKFGHGNTLKNCYTIKFQIKKFIEDNILDIIPE